MTRDKVVLVAAEASYKARSGGAEFDHAGADLQAVELGVAETVVDALEEAGLLKFAG